MFQDFVLDGTYIFMCHYTFYKFLNHILTSASVLGIAFTPPPHPLQKQMKNVVKKLNWVLPNVTSKIRTKSIRPMVCALTIVSAVKLQKYGQTAISLWCTFKISKG